MNEKKLTYIDPETGETRTETLSEFANRFDMVQRKNLSPLSKITWKDYFDRNYPGLSTIRTYKSNTLPVFFSNFVIYFLFKGNKLVYIGKTTDQLSRIATHKKDKVFDSVAIMKTNKQEISQLENYYINRYTPMYNKTVKRVEDNSVPMPIMLHNDFGKADLSECPTYYSTPTPSDDFVQCV